MNKNRDAGHRYERYVRKLYAAIFGEQIQTSRYASREMDDKKVDLCGVPMFNVQCKATKQSPHKVLVEMPQDTNYNILHYKDTKQRARNYVIMEENDWIEIVGMLKEVINS